MHVVGTCRNCSRLTGSNPVSIKVPCRVSKGLPCIAVSTVQLPSHPVYSSADVSEAFACYMDCRVPLTGTGVAAERGDVP